MTQDEIDYRRSQGLDSEDVGTLYLKRRAIKKVWQRKGYRNPSKSAKLTKEQTLSIFKKYEDRTQGN